MDIESTLISLFIVVLHLFVFVALFFPSVFMVFKKSKPETDNQLFSKTFNKTKNK